MIRKHIATWNVLGLIAAAATMASVVGCGDSKPPYGSKMASSPSMTADSTTMAPPNQIPTGAQKLSQGTYSQIMFTVPEGNGSLYVFDEDTNTVCGMTNSIQANAGKSMTMADLKNTSQGLNMTDHYRIYFAPTMPTTKPIGG